MVPLTIKRLVLAVSFWKEQFNGNQGGKSHMFAQTCLGPKPELPPQR